LTHWCSGNRHGIVKPPFKLRAAFANIGSFLPLAASPHHGGLTDIGSSLTAHSCRSRKLSMLRRNFLEADIRAGAQHFATLDDCNADEASFHCKSINGCF
jgi:hypothetical protein